MYSSLRISLSATLATIIAGGAFVQQSNPDKGRFGAKEVFGTEGIGDDTIPCDPDGVKVP